MRYCSRREEGPWRSRASLRFPRHTRSANALRTQRPYSWWRWISRTSSILSSSSLNCCWTYGEAGGGLLAVGDAGGGATGGGTNAGASARRPLPAAAPAGGGVPGLPSSAQAAHADAMPKGEAPSMPWRLSCLDKGGGDLAPAPCGAGLGSHLNRKNYMTGSPDGVTTVRIPRSRRCRAVVAPGSAVQGVTDGVARPRGPGRSWRCPVPCEAECHEQYPQRFTMSAR